MFRRPVRSALFVDFHNIASKMVGGGFAEAIPAWFTWLEDGGFDPKRRRRKFLIKRVYLTGPFKGQSKIFEDAGFDTVPTAADMVIVLDAAESLHLNKNNEEYVLLTVDADFEDLLERLGEHQKNRVVTIEPGAPCSITFPPRSEITIPIADLRLALRYERKPTLWKRSTKTISALRKRATKLGGEIMATARRGILLRYRSMNAQTIAAAANHVATLAHARPGLKVGRRTVMRYLQSNMPEFQAAGRYAGCATYKEMVQKIVQMRPDLELFREPNGGVAIIVPREDERA